MTRWDEPPAAGLFRLRKADLRQWKNSREGVGEEWETRGMGILPMG